ncbi:MAG: mevalonate kinase [Verrucomicrobia bacterium A1]|nr:MAG: mevalonate kinase [Verrucomicrobia bacterium A1]
MKAIAPGKLILSGEHAVVYDRPAIAMAVDRSAQSVIIPEGVEDQVAFNLQDLKLEESFTVRALRELKNRLMKNYRLFLEGQLGIRDVLYKPVELFQFAFITILDGLHLKVANGVKINLHSNIPIGCGMGSSAATVLSVLRGIGHYFRVEFRPEWYLAYSLEAENLQHGHASGVDSYISMNGGCARFQKGEARQLPLPRMPMHLVHTGIPETTTGECVEHVRRQFEHSAIWNDFEAVTNALEQALSRNNLREIQGVIRENHRLLSEIGVVPQKVRGFIADVEKWGAAAKVCGAGAVGGDKGGMVLVCSKESPKELCDRYGYSLISVRGEPLGARIVG